MSNLIDSIQTFGLFNKASIILIEIKYFKIDEERYEELRSRYHEICEEAMQLGDSDWEYKKLPKKLLDARLMFENMNN